MCEISRQLCYIFTFYSLKWQSSIGTKKLLPCFLETFALKQDSKARQTIFDLFAQINVLTDNFFTCLTESPCLFLKFSAGMCTEWIGKFISKVFKEI